MEPKGKLERISLQKYEVWIANGLSMQPWASLGGVAGPMSKKDAEEYCKELRRMVGITAEARPMSPSASTAIAKRGEW
jgi:hypothetical protein